MRTAAPRILTIILTALALLAAPAIAQDQESGQKIIKSHGVSRFGDLKYPADFTHFDYVNPDAPKGGTLRLSGFGTFDNLNPFVARGTPPLGVALTYDTLMVPSGDEPTSEYGLVAESVEYPEDKSWIIFNLRPEARFHDGSPITADDVVFSFNTLVKQGDPTWRFYWHNITKAEALGPHKVKFTFDQAGNSELPEIIGQLVVLPKKYWEGKDFTAGTMTEPLSSGPYKIASVVPGRSIAYERVKDYWAKDLPAVKGQFNYDRVTYDYYRDQNIEFEAFKAGQYDFHPELISRNWATGYNFPGFQKGLVKKEILRDETPANTQLFIFNTRLKKFSDPRVRQAIGYAFDFEWLNANIFYNFYTRLDSYWANSELASKGLPSPEELKLLEPYKGQIPDEVFTTAYQPPKTDGSGDSRENLRKAAMLLREAGWEVRNGKLTNIATGEVMTIEVVENQADMDRVVAPMIRNLRILGITMTLRIVDTSQMQKLLQDHNFEATFSVYPMSISPGNEQREYWGSAAADQEGSRNLIGVKNPVVDALVDKIIYAKSRADVVTATHALDRVLLWNFYAIPTYYSQGTPVAYWDKFDHPQIQPKYGVNLYTWWVDPEKVAKLQQAGVKTN